MREILFWGGTGQARVLSEAIEGTDIQLVAIADNRELLPALPGVQMLFGEAGLDKWILSRGRSVDLLFAVAVGGGRGRDRIVLMEKLLQRGLIPFSIIHRSAFVASNAIIGPGCQILAQAAVCANVRLGRGVIVNTAASVDHDCRIGDGVHLAPGARLAGEVNVDEYAFIGTGAIILPHITIGKGAVVGAGAVVVKDVLPETTVVGNPANPLNKVKPAKRIKP